MYLNEIPGYTKAIARADRLEDYWREFAFLGLTQTLRFGEKKCLEVHLLTLRMFIQLCAVRSPFLVGGAILPQHVAQILWRLSPEYDARDREKRAQFVGEIRTIAFLRAVRVIHRYIERMLIDRPASSSKNDGSKSDTSAAAALVHALASAYGWSDDQVLDLPMPRLFQYLRRIERARTMEAGNEIPTFNPLRDKLAKRVTDKFLAQKQ